MKNVSRLTCFLTVVGLYFCMTVRAASEDPWNLIAIVTDDQGVWAMGAYGNRDIVTPNMDRLASQGVRFTHAFAAAGVCTPSRVAHLTGLYAIQTGLTDVPYRDPREGLPPSVPTWPRVLKQHGYATGLIGKWHLGRGPEHRPRNFGLDYFYGFLGGSNFPMDPILGHGPDTHVVKGSLPDILVDDAIRFIDTNKARPFALMLHFRAPHAPHGPVPEVDMEPYEGLDPDVPMVDPAEARLDDDQEPADPEAIALHKKLLKKKMVTYYASVHSVDRNLGRLLKRLDDLDLSRKTIIVLTSDHGYMFGHRGLKGKGASQPIRNHTLAEDVFFISMYDESYQVPLIIRWPGVARAGRVVDELVCNVDFFPTFLSMLGIPMPSGIKVSGHDFSGLLKGEDISWPNVVFAEYTPQQIGEVEFIRMIRTPDWKLVRRYLNPGGDQLFDLRKDPRERNNLYYVDRTEWRKAIEQGRDVQNPYGPIIEQLQERLTAWQKSIDDPALKLEAVFDEAKAEIRKRWE